MNVAILSQKLSDGEDISEYTKSIAMFLNGKGHEVSIVAFEDGSEYSLPEEIDVERVPLHFEADNLYNWAMMLNNEIKAGVNNLLDGKDVDIIHANDWATVPGGITLSNYLEIPLVVTVHSTENQRGFGGENSEMISEMEWKAGFEADKVLATNNDTRNSLLFDLDVPEEKIEVIDPFDEGWQHELVGQYSQLVEEKA
ncbi:glycosyltransferase family 4 protein [Candidatus Nanohalococcus occultus]|uniref:Glycosyltransferase family 4 protein n=1 Tax=Candidatus Nanohalococcus occultus TaxID=2978047 RepID=A0ABY8CFA3_9ARCH|nr:Glycosyltransferase family 4 protein [Candidatus Nanohaloarchaeota archaeon SVXNc]